jgi:hypothetical protein
MNLNAKKIQANLIISKALNIRFHHFFNQKFWKPVILYEIFAYLKIEIYMEIYIESHINDYWNI